MRGNVQILSKRVANYLMFVLHVYLGFDMFLYLYLAYEVFVLHAAMFSVRSALALTFELFIHVY